MVSLCIPGYDIERGERDIHDRHKDGIQAVTNGHRANYFKPLGLRNNYLSGQSPTASHINPVTPAPTITRTPPQQQQQPVQCKLVSCVCVCHIFITIPL